MSEKHDFCAFRAPGGNFGIFGIFVKILSIVKFLFFIYFIFFYFFFIFYFFYFYFYFFLFYFFPPTRTSHPTVVQVPIASRNDVLKFFQVFKTLRRSTSWRMTVRSSSSLKISGRVGHRRDDQADTRRVALWVMPRRRPSGAVRTISVGKITYFPTRYLPRSLAGSSYPLGVKNSNGDPCSLAIHLPGLLSLFLRRRISPRLLAIVGKFERPSHSKSKKSFYHYVAAVASMS